MNETSLHFHGIVAMTPNRVIGLNGGMPWHVPDDLKVFKRLTYGHPVLMGRKTFESIGKPLPGRANIVLTRDPAWSYPGTKRVSSAEDLGQFALDDPEVWVIGGAQVYAQMLPWLETLWVSRMHREYPGDTWFPEFETQFSRVEKLEVFPDFDLWRYSR